MTIERVPPTCYRYLPYRLQQIARVVSKPCRGSRSQYQRWPQRGFQRGPGKQVLLICPALTLPSLLRSGVGGVVGVGMVGICLRALAHRLWTSSTRAQKHLVSFSCLRVQIHVTYNIVVSFDFSCLGPELMHIHIHTPIV